PPPPIWAAERLGSRNRQPSALGSRPSLGNERRRFLMAYLGKKDTEWRLPSRAVGALPVSPGPDSSAPASIRFAASVNPRNLTPRVRLTIVFRSPKEEPR